MIALIAAGRRGGGSDEDRATVPWSPTIATKSPPEVPGRAMTEMVLLREFFRRAGCSVEGFRHYRGEIYVELFAQANPEEVGPLRRFLVMMECIFELGEELCMFGGKP